LDVKVDCEKFTGEFCEDEEIVPEPEETVEEELPQTDQPSMFYENYPEIRVNNSNIAKENDLCIAPGEGKIPANLMRDDSWDVNAFPLLFPSGKFGMNFKQEH
jgi:hypothetical protein